MAQIRWTFQALDDLEAICLFIARDAPHVASVFADHAFRVTERLGQHPRLGWIVPELGNETIREILFGDYRIIYRLLKEEVQIVTIHHGARLLDIDKIAGGA